VGKIPRHRTGDGRQIPRTRDPGPASISVVRPGRSWRRTSVRQASTITKSRVASMSDRSGPPHPEVRWRPEHLLQRSHRVRCHAHRVHRSSTRFDATARTRATAAYSKTKNQVGSKDLFKVTILRRMGPEPGRPYASARAPSGGGCCFQKERSATNAMPVATVLIGNPSMSRPEAKSPTAVPAARMATSVVQ
jgi:hypothetical protein